MKLNKDELFAVIESVLFLIGAVFLSVVFIDDANPAWALWVGLLFALAGAALWARPLFAKFVNSVNSKNAKISDKIEVAETKADIKILNEAQSMLAGAAPKSGAAPADAPRPLTADDLQW